MTSEGKYSVLVVDDNAMNLKMISRLLGKMDVEVTTADSGAACLELVKLNHYELILMDHMMPEMDGVETFRHIKEMADAPGFGVPVIALTANTESGARELYMNEGFADFITKPVMPAAMEAALDKYLPKKTDEGTFENITLNDLKTKSKQENTEEQSNGVCEKSETAVGDTADSIDNSSENNTENNNGINATVSSVDASEIMDPDVDGLDWNFAKLHFTDHETMMEMLHDFYIMITGEIFKLQGFYDKIKMLTDEGATDAGGALSEALSGYRIQVHAMKASAALVGIIPLAGCAKILENAAAAEEYKSILAVHDTFAGVWKSYKGKLAGICDKKDEGSTAFDKEGFLQHLDKLVQASEMLDLDTMDPEMSSLAGYSIPNADASEKVDLLQGAVAALDTEMIANITEQLKELLKNI